MEEKITDFKKKLQKWKELGLSKMGILLLAGVMLFLLSNLWETNTGWEQENQILDESMETSWQKEVGEMAEYLDYQEKRLEDILSNMAGVGEVDVMLTASSSEEKVVLSDNPSKQSHTEEVDSQGESRVISETERGDETVYESNGNDQTPYVIKEIEPQLAGVLILAEGAGSATIKAEIVEAVEALFGIPVHRIKVIKRRGL